MSIKDGIIFGQESDGPEEIEIDDKDLGNLDLDSSEVVEDSTVEVDDDFQLLQDDEVKEEYKKELEDSPEEEEDSEEEVPKSEEKGEENIDTKNESSDEEQIDEEEDNVLSAFAKELADNDVLQGINEEDLANIENFGDLAKLMQSQMSNIVSSWQQEYKQNLVNNLIDEGIIKKEQVEDLLPVDYKKDDIIGNEDISREVVTAYYKEKGLSDKKISKLVNNSLDLEEDALDVYDELQEIKENKQKQVTEQLENQKRVQEQEINNRLNSWKETIDKVDEFIPGRAIDNTFKNRAFKNILPTFEKINKDLTKYGPILSLLDQYGILEGNFENVVKTVKSKNTKNQFEKILKSSSKRKPQSKEAAEIKRIAVESLKRRRK